MSTAAASKSDLFLSSLMDLTIAHMVLVHERTALSLDALVMAHVLIVVIVSHVGPIFLLESLSPALSPDTWTVHIFLVVVHIPLGQMVRYKGLWKLFLVAWLCARFLRFISLTLALSHRPFLILCRWWTEDWRTCGWWISVALVTWPESLNGSPSSLPCFLCVWLLWDFGLWLFSMLDSCSGHSFSHSLNTHEPNMRLPFLIVSLTLLLQVRMSSWKCFRAFFVGPWSCPCDASFVSSHVVPLRDSRDFLMIALVLFPGFRNASFDHFCLEHGIDQQFSAPRVPQQNGVMKRKNRTLVEMARIMLDEHRPPRCFWADAISTACYISNRIFPHSILHLTPFELRFERKPSVSHLRPIGCKCFVLKPAFCLDLSLMVDFIECSTLRLRASLF
jgi:hypothetical protein